jgi:integrase/recombinase XerC
MAGAGLRVAEASSANIEDLKDGLLTVTVKGGHRQTKPLSLPALQAARAAIGDRTEGPILTNRDGARLSRRRAWELIERLATSAGIKSCTPHTLRHTAATLALAAGAQVQDVQALLGHRSIETTLHYIRNRDVLGGAADAARRLGNLLEPGAEA